MADRISAERLGGSTTRYPSELRSLPPSVHRLARAAIHDDLGALRALEVVQTWMTSRERPEPLWSGRALHALIDAHGPRPTVLAAMAVALHELLGDPLQEASLTPDRPEPAARDPFWAQQLAAAVAANHVAGTAHPAVGLAALLRNVGCCVLQHAHPKGYDRVLDEFFSRRGALWQIEERLLSQDHTVAGRQFLMAEALPPAAAISAWLHHHPIDALSAVDEKRLIAAVNLGEALAHDAGAACVDGADAEVFEQARRHLQITPPAYRGFQQVTGAAWTGLRTAVVPLLTASTSHCAPLATHVASTAMQRLIYALAGEVCARLAVTRCIVYAESGTATQRPVAVVDGDDVTCTLQPCDGTSSWDRDAVAGGLRKPDGMALALVQRHRGLFTGGDPIELVLDDGRQLQGGVLIAGDSAARLLDLAPHDRRGLAQRWARRITALRRTAEAEASSAALAGQARRLAHRHQVEARGSATAQLASLAAGAAHELNNPLAVIQGRAQFLREQITDDALQSQVALISEHANRLSGIINELSNLAKPPAARRARLPVVVWLEQARQRWQREPGVRAGQVEVTISDRRLQAFIDGEQMQTALDAVVANALASGRSDSIRVQINSRHDPSDDTVVVSVGDNGRGMAPEVLRHACEPFFSHRLAGRGRGLGLTRAARLVENNGGRLWIESAVNVGTTVHLVLPASPPPPDHTP